MSTPLQLNANQDASTTLATANQMVSTQAGTTASGISSKISNATGWGEVTSQGTTNAWAAAGSIGAPTGLGWLLDNTSLEGQQILAGNWQFTEKSRITSGTATADMVVRYYKRSSAGVYTLIVSITLAAQSFTSTAAVYTSAATAGLLTNFSTGDKLYKDIWYNCTANSNGVGAAGFSVQSCNNAGAGLTGIGQATTPGFQPIPTALTLYPVDSASSVLATANLLLSASGSSTTGAPNTLVGTSIAWGEIAIGGNTNPWAAAGSEPAPTGYGAMFDGSTLVAKMIVAGNWSSVLKLFTNGTGTTLTLDHLKLRFWKYTSGSSTYTSIGSIDLGSQTLNTTATNFTFPTTLLAAMTFASGDYLYIDLVTHITSTTNTTSTTKIKIDIAGASASQGNTSYTITTPGYLPTPVLSTSPAALSFSASVGGANPASQNDTLSETAGAATAWTSSIVYGSGSGWLAISPSSGALAASGNATISFTCTTGALSAGTYTATVTYTATTGGATATVVVTFVVGGAATALTAYLANAASTNLTSANKLYTTAGTPTTTTRDVIVGKALKYGELSSQGATTSAVGSPYGAVYYFGGHPGGTVNKLNQKFIDLLVGGNGEAGLIPGGPIHARPQLRWELIETAKGVYDWSVADDFVARLNAANILINFNIMIPPDWRLDVDINGNHLTTPGAANGGVYASGAATAAFATLLAQRYNGTSGHGTVQIFQWNEDWDAPGTNAQRDIASQWFVENWQIVGPIFRQYAPNAILVGPASRSTTAGLIHRTTWTTHLFTYQPAGRSWAGCIVDSTGNPILDALDFHYYRDGVKDLSGQISPDPSVTTYNKDGSIATPTPAQIITNFKSIAAANGYPNFDVWCTEFGWNVYTDPAKPNPFVTLPEQSQYIQEVFTQFRQNGGSHAYVWVINPNAILDETVSPPTTLEPKSIVFNVKTSHGTTFTELPAYTDWRDTYIPQFPNWGGSGSTWDSANAIDVQTGNGWLLDPTTLEGQQILAGTWSATITLQAVSGGVGSGSLGADLYLRSSKYNPTTGNYTTIAVTSLAGQTIGSTSAAYTLAGSGILESFATGEKLYIDIWPDITSNANNDANQAIRILKVSLDTSGHTGDAGAAIVTPGYRSTVSTAAVLGASPVSLTFNATTGGSNPTSQNDTLSETAGVGTTWTSSIVYDPSASGWLALSPDHGTLAASGTQTIGFSCTTGSLIAGSYTATVTFTAASGGATTSVAVTFKVGATAPVLATSPNTFAFRASVGGANPTSQQGSLSNTGGTPTNWTAAIAYGSGSGWLSVSPASGTNLLPGSAQSVTLSCTTGSLTAATYTATITFTAAVGGATATMSVTFVVSAVVPASITIGGTPVVFAEDSWKLSLRLDERWRCQFTVLDYAGTQQFSYRQRVTFTDAVLGTLYTGFVADVKQDKSNTYPNAAIEHQIDCVDNRALADKRTSNWYYANQYAGTMAAHQVQKYLAAEGITMAAALRWDEQLTDWQAGTLAGTVATTNAYDSNPGDGDVELAPAGTAVLFVQETQSDFSGTTAGGLTSPNDGGVTFSPTQAIALKASMTVPGAGNAYIYVKVWSGSYTIAASDILHYDVWIADSCPTNNQMAAVDFVCTDGTTFRDSTGVNGVDLQGMGMHPSVDLTGLATNTWYTRRFFIDGGAAWVGKTIQYVSIAFEGDQTGDYAAYFRNIYIDNGGTLKQTIFSTTATATQTPPQQLSSNGYSALSCQACTSYERHGFMYSPAFPLAAAGIAQSSFVNWEFTPPIDPATGVASTQFVFTITASIDNFATFQPCVQNGPIPGLLPGANLAGINLYFVYVFDNNGNDPTLTPLLSYVEGNVQPAYVCTKTDKIVTRNTQAQWNAGTLTNLLAPGGAILQQNGYARTWDDASYANQTLYGTGAAQGIANKVFFLTAGASTDAKSRADFAGSGWQNFTMECDVYVSAGFNIGLNYRTTNWVNQNNTYAYLVDLNTTLLQFSRASNAGTSGTWTLITSHALTLSSGNWHRLKVVVWSLDALHTNHQIYLDDVLYITSSDNTFNAAGYVGFHVYNPTGSPVTGNFNNFGIVSALSGTWVSPTIGLAGVGSISNSEVALQIDPAVNFTLSTFLVEISLNNGGTWTTCVNQATVPGYYYTSPVPGLIPGTNAANLTQVQLRITIASSTAATGAAMPDVTAITLTVLGAYSSTGTRITPALSLAAVGRAATALVNWNANLLVNTNLAISTSIDNGASYQAVSQAGGSIAGITLQPLPFVDNFATNDSASYSQTNFAVSGGGAATWTWNTSAVQLQATQTTGKDGVLQYASPAYTDANVQVDLTSSDSGGPVARMVDASNGYVLSVRDSLAATSPNTVALFKIVAGVATQIGSVANVFVRGIPHRFVLDVQGTTLIASMDGAQLLSVTDSSITAAGLTGILAGMTNGHQLKCYGFRSQPYGDNVSGKSLLVKQTLTSTDPTATPQLLDLQAFVSSAAIGAGVLIPSASYTYTFIDKNLDDLARQSDYGWYIDQFVAFNFQARQALPSPWILSSNALSQPSDLIVDSALLVENAGDLYRNRQVLTGVTNMNAFEDPFVGDGSATSFTLRYPVAPGTIPTITLNGQAQTVGLKGTTGFQWYYAVGSPTIAQDASGATLFDLDVLPVDYTGTFIDVVIVDNLAAQAALALVEGGSGIVEAVEDVSQHTSKGTSTPGMLYPAAVTYANQLLARYCKSGRTLTHTTVRNGLAIGQFLSVVVPEEFLTNVQLLITQADITMQTQPNGTILYTYQITATELANMKSWQQLLASGLLD